MEECNKIYQNSNNFNHANPETLHKENKDKKHPLTRTIQIAPNNPASNPRQHEAPISPPPKKEPPKKKKTPLNITFPNIPPETPDERSWPASISLPCILLPTANKC